MRQPIRVLVPVAMLAIPALGDLPSVLDRVPAGASAVIGVPSLSGFHSNLKSISTLFGQGDEAIGYAAALLSTPGLNAGGSAALVILPGEDGFVDLENEPAMYAIIPVSNYDQMVREMGGDASAVITTIEMQGEEIFSTNLGGGFAALAPSEESLRGAKGVTGQGKGHGERLGMVGRRSVEGSDLFVAIDPKAFAPAINQAMAEVRENMNMAAMMMGEQGAGLGQFVEALNGLERTLTEDASSAVLAIGMDASGLTLDACAQFRAGSSAAKMAARGGQAGGLLDRVPDMAYLFAMSMDLSSPELKSWMKKMTEAAMAMNPQQGGMGFMGFGELMDLQDGSAFVMGNPPSLLMGGMFHSTVEFKRSSNGAKLLEESRAGLAKMDGMSQGGITFNSKVDAGVKEIAGTKVDTWSMRMTADPESPEGGQIAMGMSMVFGPNMGPGGYYAAVDGGMVSTFAMNDELMARAIESGRNGGGLGQGASVKEALAHLPEDSVALMLLDVGTLGRQVIGMAAMMGQPAPIEIPEGLAPVGMALSAGGGGMQGRVHVPKGVLDMIAKIQSEMGGGAGEAPGAGPRF